MSSDKYDNTAARRGIPIGWAGNPFHVPAGACDNTMPQPGKLGKYNNIHVRIQLPTPHINGAGKRVTHVLLRTNDGGLEMWQEGLEAWVLVRL